MTRKMKALLEDYTSLCKLLELKIVLFNELISTTASLKDMITEQNTDAIELLITRRNGYIAAIDKVDYKICRIKEEKSFSETLLTSERQKHIRTLVKNLEHVIKKMLQLNSSCEAAAETALNELRGDLSEFGNKSTWFKGYRNIGIPRFLDVKT